MSGSHIVRSGDTLGGIAQTYALKLDDLVRWNNIDNPNQISIGQKIELSDHQPADPGDAEPGNPSPQPSQGQDPTYVVKSGDTLSGIAGSPNLVAAVGLAQQPRRPKPHSPGQKLSIPDNPP